MEEMKCLLTSTIKRQFEWLNAIGMICNLFKTEIVGFCKDKLSLSFNNTVIELKDQVKVLGVVMDKSLSWEPHITIIISSSVGRNFSL